MTDLNADLLDGLHANQLSIRDISRGLLVKNNATNPDYQIDFNLDEVLLHDVNGNPLRVTGAIPTLDISQTGADGRDVTENGGNEKASAFYFFYVIAKDAANKASFAALDPNLSYSNLPTDYKYMARVSFDYNDPSSNLRRFLQEGNRFYYLSQQSALSGGTQTSFTAIDLSTFYPTIGKAVMLKFAGNTSNSPDPFADLSIDGTNSFFSIKGFPSSNAKPSFVLTMPAPGQQVYYKAGSGNVYVDLDVLGCIL